MFESLCTKLSKHLKSSSIRYLDILFALSVASLVAYVGIWCYINEIIPKKPTPPSPQIIVVHQQPQTNALHDLGLQLVSTNLLDTVKFLTDNNPETLNIGDIVRIKFFDISGVVIKKTEFPYDQTFSIMYRDENRRLHVVVLPKEFLSRPPAGLIHLYDLDLSR